MGKRIEEIIARLKSLPDSATLDFEAPHAVVGEDVIESIACIAKDLYDKTKLVYMKPPLALYIVSNNPFIDITVHNVEYDVVLFRVIGNINPRLDDYCAEVIVNPDVIPVDPASIANVRLLLGEILNILYTGRIELNKR